ncbi:hypothetical protein HNP55_001243 [Paucibacter oligotrophus]|uniref:Flp pilus assembly protein CpaB n=1 Tax=Roseateles oligotrophus TaxID=1769250 RepID=A0A840L956_9BURK|nr:hypothetical protein [Roseateles oligotrophus]MBB4842728.1 hypothetical protein [Roseateles oligotrophus]
MFSSSKKFALIAFVALGLTAGASAAYLLHAKSSTPAVAVVKLERVVITGKRQQLADAAQARPIERLPRVVIEARRAPEALQVADAQACAAALAC